VDKAQLISDMQKYKKKNADSEFNRTKGIKGRRKFRMCEHGVITINNFELTGKVCEKCNPPVKGKAFNIENMEPFFNIGLGCVTHGTRHAEKIAKERGLTPIGDAPISMPNHTTGRE